MWQTWQYCLALIGIVVVDFLLFWVSILGLSHEFEGPVLGYVVVALMVAIPLAVLVDHQIGHL